MPSGRLEIPALPILIPLGVVLMAVAVVVLRRQGALTAGRLGAAWFAGWYAVAVLGATMLPLLIAWGPRAGDPEYFRILPIPIVTMRPDDFVLNIAMTLPLAAVLLVVAGVRERDRAVLIGFLLSLTIELTQLFLLLFLHSNRWADSNDLIANTLGAWLGWLLLRRLLRVPAVARAADRWTLARHPEPLTRS
ncbi:VanZ family protein [Actinoplanes solisilvae]|uniref:VanZ family protein n=1 Tax=Actinoplanes solisilvae TaxID=2486853 RepID=UPI000FD90FE1|nr:VanZ family protein [Actinoplanes solisilvae]